MTFILRTLSSLLRFLASLIKHTELTCQEDKTTRDPQGDIYPTDCRQLAVSNFKIYRHETWYTYACYLSTDIVDFQAASKKLLESRFALLISLPDGCCAWNSGGRMISENLEEVDALGAHSTKFRLPKRLDPSLKVQVGIAALMRSAERNLFGENDFLEPYIRVFLSRIRLIIEDSQPIECEIQIKLYASGVVLLSFFLSEHCDMSLDAFVSYRVNLGQVKLAAVDVPVEIAHLMMDAMASGNTADLSRWKVLQVRKEMRKHYVPEIGEDGSLFVRFIGAATSTLASLGLELVETLAYCLGEPRNGIAYIIRGEPADPRWTGAWSGNPHVHLMEFSNQQTSASLNESLHNESFLRILLRSPPSTGALRGLALPENLRRFDDMGIYFGESALLWVYALLADEPIAKGTREHPLWYPALHQEIMGEVVEFGPTLYRSLLHELGNRNLSWDRILFIWERIDQFELAVTEAGNFGEVRETITVGLQVRGLPSLRQLAERKMNLRVQTASVEESRRLGAVGIILSITIGLLEMPSVIQFISDPLLPAFGLKEVDPLVAILLGGSVALVSLLLLIFLGLWIVKHRRWIHWKSRTNRI